jgi:hypothetical protein
MEDNIQLEYSKQKYYKYKSKYLQLKNMTQVQRSQSTVLQAGGSNKKSDKIIQNIVKDAMKYAKTLIGIPYRWWHEDEGISGDDKFWAKNGPSVSAEEIIKEGKCICCIGLINLVRRYVGLSIPGLDGKQGKIGLKYPGTTYTWFRYLKRKKRLEEINYEKKYPIGTLLLMPYKDVHNQGHASIIIDENGKNCKEQNIIHAYTNTQYDDMEDIGTTGINLVELTLEDVTFTHVCLPENWLLKD